MGGFGAIFQQYIGQIINIPTDNFMGWAYVVLNMALLLFGTLIGNIPVQDEPEV
jgi:hypothetical protein